MSPVPLSTIAYSAYNALAVHHDGSGTAAEVAVTLAREWPGASVSLRAVRAAFRALERLGFVTVGAAGTAWLRDPLRRALVGRDRAEGGGWTGWRVEAQPGALREALARRAGAPLLAEVLQ